MLKTSGPVLASEHDPRITRFGRLLRATRIDELPQMLNVIKGEMSLIGPRPERSYFVERFERGSCRLTNCVTPLNPVLLVWPR